MYRERRRKVDEYMLTTNEYKVIKKQVEFAVDSVLGGYQNEITDGQRKRYQLPTLIELVDETYCNVTTTGYALGCEGLKVCPEIKDCDSNLLKGIIAYEIMNGQFNF
jgi:hypothetical protein